ncbi:MAG: 50S ribosomal protein L29 [Candidatus Omnitrophota bacterium]|nr:50S ribosomal protein L29 [Candidatus Omnitrophota bacterium]
MAKINELRDLSSEELSQKLKAFKEELFNLNYQRKFGRVEKPHRFQLLKKDIARIKTILKEKKTNGA